MISEEESRADRLHQEAEKLLVGFSFWIFIDAHFKCNEAKDKFQKAANLYKLAGCWEKSAKMLQRTADMAERQGFQYEIIATKTDLAEALIRVDKKRAVELYKQTALANCEIGRFTRASRLIDLVGDLLSIEGDLEGAAECFMKAAEYHRADNSPISAGKYILKYAFLSAKLGKYDEASKTFEQLGRDALETYLMKFGASKHFLYAGFCLLAKGDVVATRMALDRYVSLDPLMHGSREFTLLDKLILAYEACDEIAFNMACDRYHVSLSQNREWEAHILSIIKNAIVDSVVKVDLR